MKRSRLLPAFWLTIALVFMGVVFPRDAGATPVPSGIGRLTALPLAGGGSPSPATATSARTVVDLPCYWDILFSLHYPGYAGSFTLNAGQYVEFTADIPRPEACRNQSAVATMSLAWPYGGPPPGLTCTFEGDLPYPPGYINRHGVLAVRADCTVSGSFVVRLIVTTAGYIPGIEDVTLIVNPDVAPPVPVLPELPDVVGQCAAVITGPPMAWDACAGAVAGATTDPLA